MRNIFAKKDKLIHYKYRVDFKLDAAPQEIFKITSLFFQSLPIGGSDCIDQELYSSLDENLKRHFSKETI